MRFVPTTALLARSVGPIMGAGAAAACLRVVHHQILFLKSIFALTIDVIGKALGGDIFIIAAKFHKLVADESVVAMVAGHVEIIRAMNHRGTLPLAKRYPNLVIKYFRGYLAKSFTRKIRREILEFHHRYLMQHVIESFYTQILEGGSVLWTRVAGKEGYTISLSFNPQAHYEGDLTLTFSQNDMPLYEISFTVVPGRLINCAASHVLLVGRIQGTKQKADAIRIATRACHDVAPPHLLLAAAQSIAGALAIEVIGGVGNTEQLGKREGEVPPFFFDYDAFWETFMVRSRGANIYQLPVPFPEKPLHQIKICHRRRSRRKRQFKKQIVANIRGEFEKKFLKTQSSQESGLRSSQPHAGSDRTPFEHPRLR
jgi:uncharacterized protein VirK/YbjX